MAFNLFISYDLHGPGRDYQSINAEIKKTGNWAKIHQTYWYVKSEFSAEKTMNHLWKYMDSNDSICVVDASNNQATWKNIEPTVAQFMQHNWNSKAA